MPAFHDGEISPSPGSLALVSMHKLLLEALRHREQELVRYLAILGPALGGFLYLIIKDVETPIFIVSTVGVLLLLLLGAVYSLALGYNFRYIILELAKLEEKLGIRDAMLVGWPRTPNDFLKRYRYCLPPEIIKIFWFAFLVGIVGVGVTACLHKPECIVLVVLIITSILCLMIATLLPLLYGFKLHRHVRDELDHIDAWVKYRE